MKRKISLILVSILVLSLVLTGCAPKVEETSGNGATENPQTPVIEYKDTLTVGRISEGVTFDPFVSIDTSTMEVCVQIYDTLVMMNEDMEIVPLLAESWKFLDEKNLEVRLKQGIKFHNGDLMDAEDIKFSIDRMVTSKAAGYIFKFLESVEVVDANTVIFKTKEPFAPILAHLSHPAASIHSQAYFEEQGEDYGRVPVGTGPYKFIEWRQGDSVRLEAFEEYFRGASPTKNLVFRAIPEASQRTIGIETGELDIAYDILPTDIERLNSNSEVNVEVVPGLRFNYLGMHTQKAPFDNVKVRQAISYAVDKESIANDIFRGAASVAKSPVPPLSFGATEDVEGYALNIEKAKQLLAEAGYPDGFSTTLWCRDDQVIIEIAQVIQSNLQQIGIDISIEVMEWGSFLEKTANGEHEMYILGWGNVTGDANYILYGLFSSAQFGVAGNRSFYSNKRVDELLALGVGTAVPEERIGYYKEIQKIVTDEVALAPLYFTNIIVSTNKKVENFSPAPTSYHKLYNVTATK